jgi:endonuclease-3
MAGRKKGRGTPRGRRLIEALEAAYPDAGITLDFGSPFELLVATVLAAQCTDERVNGVTGRLFAKYRVPRDYYGVPIEELEEDIRPTGFFRNKAKSLRNLSKALDERHGGEVPEDLESLVALPGVGRKTANIILGNAFGRNALAVDTHVRRVATRLGLTAERDPDRIESDLREIIPEDRWTRSTHLMIFHGRRCCRARRPACGRCPLYTGCRFEEKERYAAA